MTIRIDLPVDTGLDAAKAAFEDEDTLRQAIEAAAEGSARPAIAFHRLHAFAAGVGEDDADLRRALAEDEHLRADLNALLVKTATNHLPEVAAASSQELTLRESAGCRIRIEPSRAEPDQVYIIIELLDRAAGLPTTLVSCTAEGRYDRLELPEGRDGVVQVLLDNSAPVLESLRDHGTEVFLI